MGNNQKPHKHAEAIKAWADGAEIQHRAYDGKWEDCNYPYWYEEKEYRVKPKTKVIKYRVGLFRHVIGFQSGGVYTNIVDSEFKAQAREESHDFIKWITDWQEYEFIGDNND